MVSFDGVFVRGTAFRFVVIDGSGEGRVHHLTATATVTITVAVSKIHEAVNEAAIHAPSSCSFALPCSSTGPLS
jgi:hypothetical protein